jgi:hypothetical protein
MQRPDMNLWHIECHTTGENRPLTSPALNNPIPGFVNFACHEGRMDIRAEPRGERRHAIESFKATSPRQRFVLCDDAVGIDQIEDALQAPPGERFIQLLDDFKIRQDGPLTLRLPKFRLPKYVPMSWPRQADSQLTAWQSDRSWSDCLLTSGLSSFPMGRPMGDLLISAFLICRFGAMSASTASD